MKKTKKLMIMGLILALILSFASAGVYADSSDVKVTVGSKAVKFTGDLGAPFINNDGRTLVPFRAVANFMTGVKVDWDNDAREAMFGKTDLPFTIGGTTYYLDYIVRFPIDTNQVWETFAIYNGNGNIVSSHDRLSTMDTKAIIKGGRTYAPIRFLAESFLYTVGWNNSTRTVLLVPPVERTWAEDMIEHEASRGNAVHNQAEALLFAKEFARKCLHNKGTAIKYSRQVNNYLEGEEGITGWIFEFTEYNSDEVYVNSDGEIWYWNEDEGLYDLWY